MKDNSGQDIHVFFLFFHLGLGGVQRKIVDLVNFVEENREAYGTIRTHIVIRKNVAFNLESELPKGYRFLHNQNASTGALDRIKYFIFLIHLTLKYNPKIFVPYLHQAAIYCIIIKLLFFWKNIKVVISQDNVLSLENRLGYSKFPRSNKLIGWCFRRADTIITQTEYSKLDLVNNYLVSPEKIAVIKNWAMNPRYITGVATKYDLIYCGRFEKQKNLIKLLEITEEIKKNLPYIKLCLIGDGAEKQSLTAFIRKHRLKQTVSIYPPRANVIPKLAEAKIFALVSEFECHPMILIEAMSQKLVPVVLRYPGVEEYLVNDYNGFIEEDVTAFKNRVIQLLAKNHQLRTLGQNARNTIVGFYNKRLIEYTINVIKE